MAELTFIIPEGLGMRAATKAGVRSKPSTPFVATAMAAAKGASFGAARPAIQGKALMSDREVDQQLVVRAQAGDKKAFELLVIKYQRKVERLLSRIIREPAEIEDVSQEAFIKAYRALANFRGDSALHLAVPYCGQYRQKLSDQSGPAGTDHNRV